jgi:tetratricopeptide (TPR) repeat protein
MRVMTILGVLMILETAAAAAPASSPDALLERGIELRAAGRPAEALDLFQQAEAQQSSARATAQEGLAEVSLHLWLDAEGHLEAALARHDSEWIETPATRKTLEKTLADVQVHLVKLRVQGTEGADVVVEGKPVGRLPRPAPLYASPGTIKIHASAAGHAGVDKEVVGTAGEEVVANLELDLLLEVAVPPPPVESLLSSGGAPESPRWRKWTGIGLIGAGAAALATGIVWLDINNKGTCNAPTGAICEHLYDTSLQGWIALGAGVALGAGGTVLEVWKGRRQEVGVAVGPGSAALRGRF